MGRKGSGRWRAVLLSGALAGACGCMNFLHPAPPIPDDLVARNEALPQACRNHVYVFIINGNDPFHAANLDGMRDALLSLGYIKTYCGPMYDYGYYKSEILRIRQEDDNARFVVMGFSLGARTAQRLVEGVRPDGVTVDLLLYCGPVTIPDTPDARPANALQVVSVSGYGLDRVCSPLDGADNVQYPDVGHFGSPTHPYTMEVLARQLAEVASRVPVIDLRPAADSDPGDRPADHAAAVRETLPRDEWDFLKPSSPYSPPPPAPPEMPKAP